MFVILKSDTEKLYQLISYLGSFRVNVRQHHRGRGEARRPVLVRGDTILQFKGGPIKCVEFG